MADGGLGGLYRKHLPFVDWQRIESGLTGLGIPDSNFCHKGAEGWIENKATHGWKVTVRPEQVAWIERRARYGGKVSMTVRQLGRERDVLWLLTSAGPRMLIDGKRLDDLPANVVLLCMAGGPRAWDWERFLCKIKDPT